MANTVAREAETLVPMKKKYIREITNFPVARSEFGWECPMW